MAVSHRKLLLAAAAADFYRPGQLTDGVLAAHTELLFQPCTQ